MPWETVFPGTGFGKPGQLPACQRMKEGQCVAVPFSYLGMYAFLYYLLFYFWFCALLYLNSRWVVELPLRSVTLKTFEENRASLPDPTSQGAGPEPKELKVMAQTHKPPRNVSSLTIHESEMVEDTCMCKRSEETVLVRIWYTSKTFSPPEKSVPSVTWWVTPWM